MPELKGQAWIGAGLNRLVSMRVIQSWEAESTGQGTTWHIKINKDLTLHKSASNAKAFIHGAMAASAASIDQHAAARVLTDSTIKMEAKRRGMKILDEE